LGDSIARRNSSAKIRRIYKKNKYLVHFFSKKEDLEQKRRKKRKMDMVFPVFFDVKFDQKSKGFSFWNKRKGGKKEKNAFSVQK